uniref:Uncharacterized protein n=1 Tax=Gossypium raimondii TaxID=29730 RepID=A0A0D2RWV6_GOSRA|nr:hypothetical protein B456_012G033900 [Gossypium raimondii]
MGSLQEEELVQMVQDFIESEPSSPIVPSNHLQSSNRLAQLSTLQEILRCRTDTERKVIEIVLKHIRSKRDVQKSSGLKKWLAMRLKMNGFNASLRQTCWVTSSGCPAGDYEYVDIVMENENGSEEKLREIISVVCSAAKQSFREAGLHVPPWRTTTYMHSKWLSATPNVNGDFGKVNGEPKPRGGALGFSKWTPPMVKPKTQNRELGGGGSALSSQFSNMGINCC